MRSIVFFDGPEHQTLLPLTYLRPAALCRVGMKTICEKWKSELNLPVSFLTAPYLSNLYPYTPTSSESIFINGACLPDKCLYQQIDKLGADEILMCQDSPMVFKGINLNINTIGDIARIVHERKSIEVDIRVIKYPEDILNLAREEFLADYHMYSTQRASLLPDSSTRVRGSELFVGRNTKIYDAIINTLDGPVFIDDDAEIMEGAVIKGPVYIGKGTQIHVGAKIYADTILGPGCRIGGEVKRTTILGYSNKAHDGYLGDSVIGHWCNLGADTNNSNMKNTYGLVSLWDIKEEAFRKTTRQFLGMILGDHTMSAINTSFNTGTVSGIFTNILNKNPGRYVSSFSWGGDQKYDVEKAIKVADMTFARRGIKMEKAYEQAIRYLASIS